MPPTSRRTRDRLPDVLVVEDDRRVAQFVKRCLTLHGHSVSGVVASADAALAALTVHLPDVVIMDIHIEGPLDGVELAQRIRERWNLPIVYVTGQGDDETVGRAVGTGAFGFVRKPFDDVQLRAALDVALERAETERGREDALEWSRRESRALSATIARMHSRLLKIAELVGVAPPAEAAGRGGLPTHLQARVARLSRREREVLQLLLSGHRVTSIGRTLSVSPYTVRNHLRALFRKLGAHSQEDVVEMFRGADPAALQAGPAASQEE